MDEHTMVELPEITNAMRITTPGRVIIQPTGDAPVRVFHPQIGKLDGDGKQVTGFLMVDGAIVTFDIGEPQVSGSFSQMPDLMQYVETMFTLYGAQLLAPMERGLMAWSVQRDYKSAAIEGRDRG